MTRPTIHPCQFNDLMAVYPPRMIALAARDGILEFGPLDFPFADSVERFVKQQRDRERELMSLGQENPASDAH